MGVSRIPWLVSQAQHPGEFVLLVSPQLLLQHRLQEVITTWLQIMWVIIQQRKRPFRYNCKIHCVPADIIDVKSVGRGGEK